MSVILSSLLVGWSWAVSPQEVSGWVRAQPTPSGQRAQIQRFSPELSDEYADGLIQWSRRHLAQKVGAAVQKIHAVPCEEHSTLNVLSPGFAGLVGDETTARFESSVFRVESFGCLSDATVETAEAIYKSEAFRVAEMPNLQKLDRSGERLCIKSEAVTGIVEATDFCLQSRRRVLEGMTVTHNALSANNDQAHNAPMFLREEVIVFAQMGDGVGIYRIILTRGQDIGMAGKMILQRTANSNQSRVYRALEEWVRK